MENSITLFGINEWCDHFKSVFKTNEFDQSGEQNNNCDIMEDSDHILNETIKAARSSIVMLTKRAVSFTTSKALLNYVACKSLGQIVGLFRRYW